MKSKLPLPPRGLGADGRVLWSETLAAFEIDDPVGLRLLRTACEAADRAEEARGLVKKHGALVRDRFGQLVRNPAVAVERDAGRTMVQALRALNLDMAPLPANRKAPR